MAPIRMGPNSRSSVNARLTGSRPTVPAMRLNPDLKAKYAALRDVGKRAKVAIIAIMRMLLETANALVKADSLWVKNAPCP